MLWNLTQWLAMFAGIFCLTALGIVLCLMAFFGVQGILENRRRRDLVRQMKADAWWFAENQAAMGAVHAYASAVLETGRAERGEIVGRWYASLRPADGTGRKAVGPQAAHNN
jgi:hypothetical protein